MLFIAGIQPKTKRVDENPKHCPLCNTTKAYLTRVDHYLSLFFIPLIKVKQGDPFLLCEYCRQQVNGDREPDLQKDQSPTTIVCVACKKTFDGSYTYCPYCGQRA